MAKCHVSVALGGGGAALGDDKSPRLGRVMERTVIIRRIRRERGWRFNERNRES